MAGTLLRICLIVAIGWGAYQTWSTNRQTRWYESRIHSLRESIGTIRASDPNRFWFRQTNSNSHSDPFATNQSSTTSYLCYLPANQIFELRLRSSQSKTPQSVHRFSSRRTSRELIFQVEVSQTEVKVHGLSERPQVVQVAPHREISKSPPGGMILPSSAPATRFLNPAVTDFRYRFSWTGSQGRETSDEASSLGPEQELVIQTWTATSRDLTKIDDVQYCLSIGSVPDSD